MVKCIMQITIALGSKFQRKVFYQEKRMAIRKMPGQLNEWKGEKIREAEANPEHIHLLVEIPAKGFMSNLRGKRAARMYEQLGD
ncbi:MAG TPA: transposase [Firmicutes bacterium]|nr:transposase [Bacillota bacterium]